MDFLTNVGGDVAGSGLGFLFKIVIFFLLIAYIFYSLILTLRVRILADTVETSFNNYVKMLSIAHLIVVLIGSFLIMVIFMMA